MNSGWKTQETQKLPQLWYRGKRGMRIWINECYGEMLMWNSQSCPSFGIHKRFWSTNEFCFTRWGFMSIGLRNSCETHKTASVLVFGEEFEWTKGVISKEVSGNGKDWVKRIALVGLFFLLLAFGQIIGCSLLHETLFFFHFFFWN